MADMVCQILVGGKFQLEWKLMKFALNAYQRAVMWFNNGLLLWFLQ